MTTPASVALKQSLNRALEMIGLPAQEITEVDRLEGACFAALSLLYDGHIEAAKAELRMALNERKNDNG